MNKGFSRGAALGATLAALVAQPLAAAQVDDPTWPCIQRKQPHLSPAAMWAGPPIDQTLGDWRDDPEVSRLVPVLAVRRTDMEEAARLIGSFADRLDADRNRRLALLFSGIFERIDRERTEVVAGIGRYAGKQQGLSDALDATRAEIASLEEVEDPSFDQQDRLEELQDKLAWDTRIYEERRQSLTYVCESPVLLEQRAFALAREIMKHLEE